LINKIIEKFLSLFNIPVNAVRYFRLSNKLSGLTKSNFPKELVSLNTKQLTRGMLNYTFIQHYPGWKLPFWAVRQYDINNNSFVPRSHLGVSVNVTHRNWTAIGNINCDVEPIVDPCGSVTPFVDGWSLECWIKYNDHLIIPAYHNNVKQKLIDDLPIVETAIVEQDYILILKHYTYDDSLICEYEIENKSPENISLDLILAIRPFNPEGISLINSIQFDEIENTFIINKFNKVYFDTKSDRVILSNLKHGDSANKLDLTEKLIIENGVDCEYGFANALSLFSINLYSYQKKMFRSHISLSNTPIDFKKLKVIDKVVEQWDTIIDQSIKINVPDPKVSSQIKSSLSTSLQFIDSDKITPGAAIYHQFWFRDAAFQLNTLDKFGFSYLTKKIFKTFFSYQKKDGYFQSQKGEWDSNGQVQWMIMQNALLTNNLDYVKEHFNELYESVKWIDKKRILDKKYSGEHFYGLLPKGLSAEHLGLADYYYWDNFWSIAGLKSFILICELLKNTTAKNYTENILVQYEKTLRDSISKSVNNNIYGAIPSAPNKDLDTGMIGTIPAIYPLQIIDWDNELFDNTLEYIYKNYFHKNLFFQNIIHSGGNPYITLQIAHSFLYRGNRKLFTKIINDVFDYASPTLNFPEAIHPITGGGIIGDGHHGWAAAEVLLAMRDAFVYERNYYSLHNIELVLISGIPIDWFLTEKELTIKNTPILSGSISITVLLNKNVIDLKINYSSNSRYSNEKFVIVLPFIIKSISGDSKESDLKFSETKSMITFNAKPLEIKFYL
jgi:hypothetical protein